MELIPLLGAVCTLALGILGLVAPRQVSDLVGVAPEGALGLSEVRATYGGLFVGLGAACLWFQQSEVYVAVGVAWLLAAVFRIVSIFLDQAFSGKNVGGVIVEAGIGYLLVAGML
ncbi:DUF4345 family protein [Marinobacter arenosus]|uniref:DUF4345 family protein n=1 Tax=Marinobacter arenosus TaxID=2856822 RepID=UPI001C4A8DD6|nr:DUF4345 family protein [Marinobacter arenosus]MBW0149029.1 DUF4345 family protein [Marinobacter arenosus]